MPRGFTTLFAALLVGTLLVSCSTSNSPVITPDPLPREASDISSSHMLAGLYQFYVDPATQTFEYTQMRYSSMHLNVLVFLEPQPLLYLTIEGGVIFDFENYTMQCDIGLTHPFLGLNEFAGFDVKGICISRADLADDTPSTLLKMPGPSTLRLTNADGYSRMWNPDEFPFDPDHHLFTYKDGMLGSPDSYGQYDAQLNGYKYFCDSLGPGDPVASMDLDQRGLFSPGAKNVRTYMLSIPQGLIFNYAIDANWEFPKGPAPWEVPDAYSLSANSPEAYNIECDITGTMYSGNYGSNMDLSISVYDHQPGTVQYVFVESKYLNYTAPPDPPAVWTAAFQYSTDFIEVYTVQIQNLTQVDAGDYAGIIHVVDTEVNPFLPVADPPEHYTSHKLISIPVIQAPSIVITLDEDAAMKGEPGFNVSRTYDAAYFLTPPVPPDNVVDYMDHDGPWMFDYLYDDTVELKTVPATDAEVAGFVGLYPPETTHFYYGEATYENEFQFRPYMGEYHDYANGVRKVYGVTETFLLGTSVVFNNLAGDNVPMEFIYPYDHYTDFTTIGRYFVTFPIPYEAFTITWRVRGLGEGQLQLSPAGATYPTLLLRHDISLKATFQTVVDAIVYEWLTDDGIPLAYIVSANSEPLGWGNYFNPATGFIFGESRYHVLQGY